MVAGMVARKTVREAIRARRPLIALAGLATALTLTAQPANAWWEYGHETVANIAWARVKPATRARIDALLRHSAELGTAQCPARTLAEASVWPDCVKPIKGADGKNLFGYAYNWHFVDVDICKPFALPAGEDNVVAQIPIQAAIAGDTHAAPVDRLRALAFITHLVGDLHQPLHAGSRDDQGANKVHAAYGIADGRRSNLHAIWDGWLAERAISTPPGGPRGLLRGVTPGEARQWSAGTPVDWARESAAVSHDIAYASAVHGADPCANPPPPASVDNATIPTLIPTVREQVVKGGLRLARLLDRTFATR